jgi:hypothetical protein
MVLRKKWTATHRTVKLGPYFSPYENQLKWIKHLHVRPVIKKRGENALANVVWV